MPATTSYTRRQFLKFNVAFFSASLFGFVPRLSLAEDKPADVGSLRLGWVKSTANLMAAVAPDLSARHGLQIESLNFNSAQDILTGLISGQLDIGLLTPVHLLRAIDTNVDVFQIAGNTGGNTGVVAHKMLDLQGGDWDGLKELLKTRRLKVASSRGSINELLAMASFKKNGIDVASFDFVNIANFAQHPQALRSGDFDFIITLEPLSTMAVAEGLGTLFMRPYDTDAGDLNTNYVATKTIVAEQPAKVAAFVSTLADAMRYCADPKAELDLAMKLTGLQADVLRVALDNCRYDLSNDAKKIEALAKISWDLRFTSRDLSDQVEQAIDDRFVADINTAK